jgi:hypothetical protein
MQFIEVFGFGLWMMESSQVENQDYYFQEIETWLVKEAQQIL